MKERTVGRSTTRRRLLGAAGGALAGAGVLSGLSSGASDDGSDGATSTPTPSPTPTPPDVVWPLFQFDQHNTGHQPNTNGPERSAGAVWSYLDGEEYTTTPVVTESEVFVADEGAGVVRAHDVFSGEVLWESDVPTRNARMTLQGRTLYVPTQEAGSELQVLDANTGEQRWNVSLASGGNGVVEMGGSLYVSTAGGVSKVSLLSNTVSWEYESITLLDTTIAVEGDSVFAAGTRNGKAVKLSVADGSANWTNNLEGTATGAPTVVDNTVLLPYDEALVAVSKATGREQWRTSVSVGSSVAAADGTAYGTTTDGAAFAVDTANGAKRWQTGVTDGSVPPVLVGGVLFVAGTDGVVAGLNPRDGSVIWSTNIGAPAVSNPAVYDGDLYVADLAGRLAKLAAGASGGYDTPTPSETPTDTPTETPTETPTPTTSDPGGDGNGNGNGNGDDDDGGGVTTPIQNTPTPGGGGLGNLPLVGGVVAAVLAALGGGLWWRNQQQDDYDPLG